MVGHITDHIAGRHRKRPFDQSNLKQSFPCDGSKAAFGTQRPACILTETSPVCVYVHYDGSAGDGLERGGCGGVGYNTNGDINKRAVKLSG